MRFVALILGLLWGAPAWAGDLHELWDRQCGGCHGHAGIFARDKLRLDGDVLRSRSGSRPASDFLILHNGGYSAEHIAAIQDMLRAQLSIDPVFRRVCGDCHDTGAQLVRDYLAMRDDRLILRESGQDLEKFLRRHGRAGPADQQVVTGALTRIWSEIHHP